MAKCVRCGAGNEWIEGDRRKAPKVDDSPNDAALDLLRAMPKAIADVMYPAAVHRQIRAWLNKRKKLLKESP